MTSSQQRDDDAMKSVGDQSPPTGSAVLGVDGATRGGALPPVPRGSAQSVASQVYRRLSEAIGKGEYAPGDRLPPERLLAAQLGVSRVTLRRALKNLASEGVLQPTVGSGWYVLSHHLSEPPNILLSFSEMAEERGLTSSTRMLSNTVRPATFDEAERLRVAPGARVLDLERLRLLDGLPIALNRSLLPVARLPAGIALKVTGDDSLYRILEREGGVAPARAECVVEARVADEREADLLDVKPGSALLIVVQTMYDAEGRPFESGNIAYRGDTYRFRATLVRPAGSG